MLDIKEYKFCQTKVENHPGDYTMKHYDVVYKEEEVCTIFEVIKNSKITSAYASRYVFGEDSVGKTKEEALEKFLHGEYAPTVKLGSKSGIAATMIVNESERKSFKTAIYWFILFVGGMLLFTGQIGLLAMLGLVAWLFAAYC